MYNNLELAKFINNVMQRGKKTTAQRICYNAFDIIKEQSNREPLEVFQLALKNATPMVEVKPKRVGGATYQVPTEISPKRASSLAMRWLASYSRARPGKSMRERLANEIIDAANERGESVKKREDTHRMADANKAFAHYRW
jgi:small subunit ribosomal protein S7